MFHRLREVSNNNQLLIQQFNQLSQHMLWALEENRNLRREIIGLTRDLSSILLDHINSQQRSLALQQEIAAKTSRITELESHITRLQEKITSLDNQLVRSISRTQIIIPNPTVTTNNANMHSSATNAPNNH
ncbi:hypothetical protein RVIR1_00440 [Candidatus Rickettsiella viridis]|uniref:Uncharacterized protein n=1 Tax=Candidatus Rickettsiella viridis TaxID=676208 RepID=A0A2Z5USM4_9COXI|nr:hypothetical protein [Candidatus Rickettsiella viridis]BBB14586.1 hypothetical protein RVIR1_00440 [Candidatus Rickettsiella viridis]